jgi:predicted protein tyrosine phosphatase
MHIPFRITICGLDELAAHANMRVTHVLSILDPEHPVPEVFGTYGEHEKLELRFDDIIDETPGKIAPSAADVEALLTFGHAVVREPRPGAHLLVHCHAGISRSSASMALLVAQAAPSHSGTEIFKELLRIRPQIWPNLRLIELGDAALNRGGELVAAVRQVYAQQISRQPRLVDYFRSLGRERELNAR